MSEDIRPQLIEVLTRARNEFREIAGGRVTAAGIMIGEIILTLTPARQPNEYEREYECEFIDAKPE